MRELGHDSEHAEESKDEKEVTQRITTRNAFISSDGYSICDDECLVQDLKRDESMLIKLAADDISEPADRP